MYKWHQGQVIGGICILKKPHQLLDDACILVNECERHTQRMASIITNFTNTDCLLFFFAFKQPAGGLLAGDHIGLIKWINR